MLPDDLAQYTVPPLPLVSDELGFSGFSNGEGGLPLFPSLAPDKIVITFFGGGDRSAAFLRSARRMPKAGQDFFARLATICLLAGHRPVAIRPVIFGVLNPRIRTRFLSLLGEAAKKQNCRLVLPELLDVHTEVATVGALVFAEKDTCPAYFQPAEGDIIVAAADIASAAKLQNVRLPDPYTNWGEKLHKVRSDKYPRKQRVIRFAACVDEFTMRGLRGVVVPRVGDLSAKIASKRLADFAGKSGIIVVVAPHFARRVQKRLTHLNRRATVDFIGKLARRTPAEE
ncbi:MAG: hypothetical protein WC712_12165 [Candidatus Brocadiia bacterium]